MIGDTSALDNLSTRLISYSQIISSRKVGGVTVSQFYSNVDSIELGEKKYNCRIWVNKDFSVIDNENLPIFIGCSSADSAVFSSKMNDYFLCITVPGLNFNLIKEREIKCMMNFVREYINTNFKIDSIQYHVELIVGVGFVDKIKLLGSPYEADISLMNNKFDKIYYSNLKLMKQFPFLKICNTSLPLPPCFLNNLLSVNGVYKAHDSNLSIVKSFKEMMLEMPNFNKNPYNNFNKIDFLKDKDMVHSREIHLELSDNLINVF